MKITMLNKLSLCFLLAVCTLNSTPGFAQGSARYISDVLYIPIRAGMGNNYDVVKPALISGTRVTLIREESDGDNNTWSLVQTADGKQGWIRSQHLLAEPTASIKLERVNAQLAKASTSVKEAVERQKAFEQLQTDYDNLQKEHQELLSSTESLRQTSAAAIDLEKENQRTLENNQLLQTRVDVLLAENEHLKDADRYNQWVYGAGLLFCGILLSFFLQAIGKRKRQSDWR